MSQHFAVVSLLKSIRHGSPLLWRSSLLMLAGVMMCIIFLSFDARLIGGVNVWEKPAKFFLSLAVQALTVGWAMSLVPTATRGIRTAGWIFVGAAWMEMAYIVFRAGRGEASHFNQSSGLAMFMYALMGVGAVLLVTSSAFVGWRVWQTRGNDILRLSAAVGLMLGATLGLIAGAYLSSHSSHWIGGDLTDATGLPFLNWSTTGGDLRVSHFIGLHATQAVPLAGLSGQSAIVYGVAVAVTLAMAATFVMAAMGIPLLRV